MGSPVRLSEAQVTGYETLRCQKQTPRVLRQQIENRTPEGGRRSYRVSGARYADMRDLGSIEICLGRNEL